MGRSKGSTATYVIMLLLSAGFLALAQQWYPDDEYTVWTGDEGTRRRQSAIKLDVDWVVDTLLLRTDFTDSLVVIAAIDSGNLQKYPDTLTFDATRTWVIANSQEDADTNSWDATKTDLGKKTIGFTVELPADLTGDSCIIPTGAYGSTFTIDSVQAWSTTDDYDFSLKEYTVSGGAAGGVIKAVTVSTDGTNVFYSGWVAPTHATIESGNTIWFVPSADSTAWVSILIKGHL